MSLLAGFHLHFYQPPREDPWLGLVANEWSAWPFHDWNERIATECYRALAAVALPAGDDGGVAIAEPLSQSSFNIGPTLHHWLVRSSPDVDHAIVNQVRNLPHGPASVVMAMPLVHAILPLATYEDKQRLVRWGVVDYEARYGVAPRGMWLPETGVDNETLEVLVDNGISYTVLMPTQAMRVRAPGGEWTEVNATSLDTSLPYFVQLADGRRITVVFGNHELSQSAAFGTLVDDGTHLADVMATAAQHSIGGAALIVADGETYGHHHRFGDLGVAWALRRLHAHYGIETALGPWLEQQTVVQEVELAAVSAWSCAHGVERWRSACGCVTGERPGWSLEWRAPLRNALNWLRTHLGTALDEALGRYVADPAAVLLAYGEVIVGRVSPVDFALSHLGESASPEDIATLLTICEAHRNLLYSFTSCAWFFADPGEIETSIVLRYAAVALEQVRQSLGLDLEADFVSQLTGVYSPLYAVSGAALWHRACAPYRVDPEAIAAAFAAEAFVRPSRARVKRGEWSALVTPTSATTFSVVLTHDVTQRTRIIEAKTRLDERFGLSVSTVGETGEHQWGLADLGRDVVARLATTWLDCDESEDVEMALNNLVAELLVRPATTDDETVLVALSVAPRFVTPIAEASIRRALLAMVSHDPAAAHRPSLTRLRVAVGLEQAAS